MKHLTRVLLCIFIATTNNAISQDINWPSSEKATAWEKFKAENGNNWVIRWDTKKGIPTSLSNGKTKSYGVSSIKAARSFLNRVL